MTIIPGLAAELGLLTQALDVPGTDVAEILTRLAADAQTAVNSYLGLSVLINANRSGVRPLHPRRRDSPRARPAALAFRAQLDGAH